MGLEVHFEIEIAGRAATDPGRALAGQADHLAFAHSLGDAYIEIVLGQYHTAAVVLARRTQGNGPGVAAVGGLQVEQDLGMMIVAPGPESAARAEAAAPRAAHAAKEFGKEIAEVRGLGGGKSTAAELEPGVPVRWRPEFLSLPVVAAQLVVGGALLGIGEHRIGLVDLPHSLLGIRLLGDVRMVLARQLAKRLLDLVGAGIPGDAQNLIVVLEFHRCGPLLWPWYCPACAGLGTLNEWGRFA